LHTPSLLLSFSLSLVVFHALTFFLLLLDVVWYQAMSVDLTKMPLGKLSRKSIIQGYRVLKQLEIVLDATNAEMDQSVVAARTVSLSTEFYHHVPHVSGYLQQLPTIATKKFWLQKVTLLNDMLQMCEPLFCCIAVIVSSAVSSVPTGMCVEVRLPRNVMGFSYQLLLNAITDHHQQVRNPRSVGENPRFGQR
jgi:hypothetical protein